MHVSPKLIFHSKPEASSFLQPLDGQPNGNEAFHPAIKAPVVAESSVPITSDTGYITSTNVIPSLSNKDGLKRKVPHDGFEEPEKPVKTVLFLPRTCFFFSTNELTRCYQELGYPHVSTNNLGISASETGLTEFNTNLSAE